MGALNLYQTPHQTLNLYLLPKLEFIFHFALCSQSLPVTFSKQCSAFPRQLGEVPPTQILFYLRQTDRQTSTFTLPELWEKPRLTDVFETRCVCTQLNTNTAASLTTSTGRGTWVYWLNGKILHWQTNVSLGLSNAQLLHLSEFSKLPSQWDGASLHFTVSKLGCCKRSNARCKGLVRVRPM